MHTCTHVCQKCLYIPRRNKALDALCAVKVKWRCKNAHVIHTHMRISVYVCLPAASVRI
jgi:hypothetical protein